MRSIALHRAASAGSAQLGAQFLGTGVALGSNVDSCPTHAPAREAMVKHAGLTAAKDGRIPFLQSAIGGKCRGIR
jgi:hypothetical protein